MTEDDVRKLLGLTLRLASDLALKMSLIYGQLAERRDDLMAEPLSAADMRVLHCELLAHQRELAAALHNVEVRDWLDSLDWTLLRLAANPQIGITAIEAIWRIAADLDVAILRVLQADKWDYPAAIENLSQVVVVRPELVRLADVMQSEVAVVIDKIREQNRPLMPVANVKPEVAKLVIALGDAAERLKGPDLYFAVSGSKVKNAPPAFRQQLSTLVDLGVLFPPSGSGPGSTGYGLTEFGLAIYAQLKS